MKIVPFVMLAIFIAYSAASFLDTAFQSFAMALGN